VKPFSSSAPSSPPNIAPMPPSSSERARAYGVFAERLTWVPQARGSALRRSPDGAQEGFALRLLAGSRFRASAAAVAFSADAARIGLQYSAVLYDSTTRTFFGRTYRSPRILPALESGGGAAAADGSATTDVGVGVAAPPEPGLVEAGAGDLLLTLTSLTDPSVLLVVEPTLLMMDEAGTVLHAVSLGWTALSPFQDPSPFPDSSDAADAAAAAAAAGGDGAAGEAGGAIVSRSGAGAAGALASADRVVASQAPVFAGSPRALLLASPASLPSSPPPVVPGASLSFVLTRHSSLRRIHSLVRDAELFGPLDEIPGLAVVRVPRRLFAPRPEAGYGARAHGDRSGAPGSPLHRLHGTGRRDGEGADNEEAYGFLADGGRDEAFVELACLADPTTTAGSPDSLSSSSSFSPGLRLTVPRSPTLAGPTLGLTLKRLLARVPSGYDARLLRVLTANREVELGLRPGSIPASAGGPNGPVRVVGRILTAAVHNGHTVLASASTALHAAAGGSHALTADVDALYLSSYTPHQRLALVFALEYIVAEPTAALLGLRSRKDQLLLAQQQQGGAGDAQASSSALAASAGGGAGAASFAAGLLAGGTSLEHRRRILVARQVYVPFVAGRKGGSLVFANRSAKQIRAADEAAAAVTGLSAASEDVGLRAFELPLAFPNPALAASLNPLAIPLDGSPAGGAATTASAAAAAPTGLVLAMDVGVAVETRKKVARMVAAAAAVAAAATAGAPSASSVPAAAVGASPVPAASTSSTAAAASSASAAPGIASRGYKAVPAAVSSASAAASAAAAAAAGSKSSSTSQRGRSTEPAKAKGSRSPASPRPHSSRDRSRGRGRGHSPSSSTSSSSSRSRSPISPRSSARRRNTSLSPSAASKSAGRGRSRERSSSRRRYPDEADDDSDGGYESPDSVLDDSGDQLDGTRRSRHSGFGPTDGDGDPDLIRALGGSSAPGAAPADPLRGTVLGDLLSLRCGEEEAGTGPPLIVPSAALLNLHPGGSSGAALLPSALPTVSAADSLAPFPRYPDAASAFGHALVPEERALLGSAGVRGGAASLEDGAERTAIILASCPVDRLVQTELSDPLPTQTIAITFAAVTPNHAGAFPARLAFSFQFFTSPLVRTAPVCVLPPSASAATRPGGEAGEPADLSTPSPRLLVVDDHRARDGGDARGSLSSSASSLLTVRIDVDPTTFAPSERPLFASYLASKALLVEVWDADALLPVGTATFHLAHLLRQQAQLVSSAVSCDIITPTSGGGTVPAGAGGGGGGGFTASSPLTGYGDPSPLAAGCAPVLGLPAPHPATYAGLTSGTVVGRLLVVASNHAGSGSWKSPFSEESTTGSYDGTAADTALVPLASSSTRGRVPPGAPGAAGEPSRSARTRVLARPLQTVDDRLRTLVRVRGGGRTQGAAQGPDSTEPPADDPLSVTLIGRQEARLGGGGGSAASSLDEENGASSALVATAAATRPPSRDDQDVENAHAARLEELRIIQAYRESARGKEAVAERLREGSTATYRLFPSYGRTAFFEHTFRNPSPLRPETFVVKVEDGAGELRVVTSAAEWAYLRSVLPLACADAGLPRGSNPRPVLDVPWSAGPAALAGGAGGTATLAVTLGPGEQLTLPLVFVLSVPAAAAVPPSTALSSSSADAGRARLRTVGLAPSDVGRDPRRVGSSASPVDGPFGAGAELPPAALRTVHVEVTCASFSGPVSRIRVEATPRPFPVHRTVRFFQAENTYLRATLPLPPVQLQQQAASSTFFFGGGGGGGGGTVSGVVSPVFAVCTDTGVLAHAVDAGGMGGQDLVLRFKAGAFPSTASFYVLLYSDPYRAVLHECWRVVVHSLLHADVHTGSGVRTDLDLVVRGSGFARTARLHSSSSAAPPGAFGLDFNLDEVRIPSRPLSLLAQGLSKVGVSLVPLLPTASAAQPRPVHITLVDTERGDLVAAWQLAVSAAAPVFSRVYDIRLPAGGALAAAAAGTAPSSTPIFLLPIPKMLSYANPWERAREVTVRSSHPALVRVLEPALRLAPRAETSIKLDFARAPVQSSERVFIYVEDETGALEDTLLLRVAYVPRKAGTVSRRERRGAERADKENEPGAADKTGGLLLDKSAVSVVRPVRA
jgi:hypothetical protein